MELSDYVKLLVLFAIQVALLVPLLKRIWKTI